MAVKKGGLGRGLDALFADQEPVSITEPKKEEKPAKDSIKKEPAKDTKDAVIYVSIHDIKPNKNQPRKTFDEDKIFDLAKSILENGIIQPIVVRKSGKGYEIVAGERRWRAARMAELDEVPCIVRELTDEQNMLFAIIENMQREDLNPVEEAEGINQMMTTYKLTQDQVAKSLGKSRPYIANAVRLLKLPEKVKEFMQKGKLSAAHGRTLAAIDNEAIQIELAEKIVKDGLSVREVEKLAAEKGKPRKKKTASKKEKEPDLLKVEAELKESLGTRVSIAQGAGNKGKIEIEYYSKDELDRLIDLLKNL